MTGIAPHGQVRRPLVYHLGDKQQLLMFSIPRSALFQALQSIPSLAIIRKHSIDPIISNTTSGGPTPTSSASAISSPTNRTHIGAIIGGVICGVVALLLILCLILLYLRRRGSKATRGLGLPFTSLVPSVLEDRSQPVNPFLQPFPVISTSAHITGF